MTEFDIVRIKGTNITGTIVDMHKTENKTMCYIDSKQRGVDGEHGYDADWDLYHCAIDELELYEP